MRRAKALRSSFDHALVNVKHRKAAHSPNKRWIEREQFTGNTDCTSIRFSPRIKVSKKRYPASDQDTPFM